MDNDDDFLPSAQIRRRPSQYGSEARFTETSRTVSGSRVTEVRPSTSRTAFSSQSRPTHVISAEARPSTSQPTELSQPEMDVLKKLAQQLTTKGLNLDTLKPTVDKKPLEKEKLKCIFHPCKSMLASKNSLFRHYKIVHSVVDPEKFHGCTVDNNVVNLDDSLVEHKCVYCGHVASNANALDVHSATSHGTVQKNNQNKSVHNINTSIVAEASRDIMLKCDECSGYFQDRSKLDEHQKMHHGYQAQCKICNKNFLFKDFDVHVKSSHPEVNGKKEEVIVKKPRLNLGRGFVYSCTKCSERFFDEDKAKKHAKAHVRGFKMRVVRNNIREGNNDSNPVSPPERNILFICEPCNVATASCDSVVQHSQNHITDPNTKFRTETCDVCNLTFEPTCYEKHLTRHYKDKQLCKESFTIHTYKYHLLFSDDWTSAFNKADEEVKKILSQSIYAHTRSVKMRILSVTGTGSKVLNLYKCGQCNTFVDPASVANHTSNYNTCVNINKKNMCKVCDREFNTKLARDKHQIEHNGEKETLRIVAFNATRDKEFNEVLNDPNVMTKILKNQVSDAENNNNEHNVAVIYKCPCGLRFVSKKKSENHLKVCPKNDPIQNCPKCDALFCLSELDNHLKQHTIGGSKFVIKEIANEPIVIDSDDDSENDSSDKIYSNANKNQIAIKVEMSHTDDNSSGVPAITILDSDDEMAITTETLHTNSNNDNEIDLQRSENVEVSRDEQTNNDDAVLLPITTTEDEDMCISESADQTDLVENHGCDLNNDDDSQGNICYEEPLNANTHEYDEIKCVPTNLLLSPSKNFYGDVLQTGVGDEFGVAIKSMRRHTATIEPVTVKQERNWISNPTDYSSIGSRPALRQIDRPISSTIDLLTDDEDDMGLPMNPDQTENINISEDNTNNDSDTLLSLSGHTVTENVDEEINDIPRNTIIAQMDSFNSTEIAAKDEVQPENETQTLAASNADVNEDEIVTQSNAEVGINREWDDFFISCDQLSANNSLLNRYSDRSSLFKNKSHTALINYGNKSINTIVTDNSPESDHINQVYVVENRFSITNGTPDTTEGNVSNPKQNNAVALVVPDVLINIDNIKRELDEPKTKCKLLNSSNFDVENTNLTNVKTETNSDRSDYFRRTAHRQALDWPTLANSSNSQDHNSMVLFQNVPNNGRRNRVPNYNLNILVSDQNGSIKQSNNCTIC